MTARIGIAVLVLATCFVTGSAFGGQVDVPASLPRYRIEATVDVAQRVVQFRQTVTWTNTHARPANELVFSFYPQFSIPSGDSLLLGKTLELLRLNPSYGIDEVGRHGVVNRATLVREVGGRGQSEPLKITYKPENQTALVTTLPQPIRPGESVTVELEGTIHLPEKQGRWGQWQGVTFLANALPVVAYYDDAGWHDMPFIPWHQPFWNEAGVYTASITLPVDQVVGCSAEIASVSSGRDGWKTLTTKPFVGREFGLVCSALFKEYTSTITVPDGRSVTLKCVAYPHHEFYAREMLRIAGEAIPVYCKWFGPFPYEQFTIAESFFGWNGNELSGMVLIDERVFDMPKFGVAYVEYLVSHETSHQWWYDQIGTNGYAETWIDEGAATHFTHRLMDQKLGKNNAFFKWPAGAEWLPNVYRDNYRFGGMYGAIRRDEVKPAAGAMTEFGNLYALFNGAYDRGSKVFGMIENRLGEAAMLDFLHGLFQKYSFRYLSADAFKAELIAYTGPQSAAEWDAFFEKWVYGRGLTDWGLESVSVSGHGPRRLLPSVTARKGKGVPVEVVVTQTREIEEPTVVGFQFADSDGFPVRIPVGPNVGGIRGGDFDAEVEPLGSGRYVVRATLPSAPSQVMIDPDRALLDADPSNNVWVKRPTFKVVPFYSFLYDNDLTNDYDRWNFTAGPWLYGAFYADPWYTRASLVGARVGAYRTQEFYGGAYAAFRTDYKDLVVGVDGVWSHFPLPNTEVGFNVERRVAGPWGGTDGSQTATRASLYGRYILSQGSSMYLPPFQYVDLFTTYQDNFLPFARNEAAGADRPSWTELTGAHYRLNLYTPYWDPERGVWVDLVAAGGAARLNDQVGTAQLRGELATTQKLPDGYGYWSGVKVAGRAVVQGAWPTRGEFYALGGSTLFRGFDLAERQGSFLWVANAEVRLPVVRDAHWNVADSAAGVRNVSLAAFYDVGNVYAAGQSVGGTAHALGVGARVDLAVFSFIERATLRFDVAKTINAATPFQFWFGVQHPF